MMTGFSTAILILALQGAQPTPTQSWGLALQGAEAENFLQTAKIVSVKNFKTKGVTRPEQVVLTDGELTLKAVFKTVDEYESIKHFAGGETELQFTDSYKYEIAAYELDKLLDLGIVPPAVKRRINRYGGSLSLWVEGAMTEWERITVKKVHDPDTVAWNNRMYTVRLFLQLIYDTDYNNINNLLVTPDWKIYKIDSSRAFRNHKELRREESLARFSRPVLERLRALTREDLDEHLSKWLSKLQRESLWVRRNLILELADRRVAEEGETVALYD
jgi:hypothetical protein